MVSISIRGAAIAAIAAGIALNAAAATNPPAVVLVHGAFADGSSWSKVIPLLKAKHLNVIAVQNPLNSFAEDVAATQRAIDRLDGPVVLVGHSYGGAVITEAGNAPKVKALVYVAAFAPDEGQSVADVAQSSPPPPGMAEEKADAAGFVTLTHKGVQEDFAQDLSPQERNLVAATQGPTAGAVFGAKISRAAWKSKPAWYIVASNDRMISPKLEQQMSERMRAKTTTIASSHVPMLSHPDEVAATILAAVDAASTN